MLVFDFIYLNRVPIPMSPCLNWQLLCENFVKTKGKFFFTSFLDTKDIDQISKFLEQFVKDSCECWWWRLDILPTYKIAKRLYNWLKLQKDYLYGLGDTLVM